MGRKIGCDTLSPIKSGLYCIIRAALLLLVFNNAKGQGYGDEWIISTPNVLVSFDTTCHFDYFDISPNFCARELVSETDNICDLIGNIQFYYNGMNIISYKKYGVMDNGDSLDCCLNQEIYQCGSATPNASVIIPSTIDSNKYFVFQINIDTTANIQGSSTAIPSKMLRHTVDMSQNNGEGQVISKNEVMFRSQYLLPRLTAVKHANGRDWWLIGHSFYGNNIFYIWLIQNDVMQSPLIQQIGSYIYGDFYGKTTFSPDGTKMAMVTDDDTLNLFDFDRCAGVLSNAQKLYIYDSVSAGDDWLNSCAFSADSRFLYTSGDVGKIRQFDMTIPNLESSMEIVGEYQMGDTNCYGNDYIENGMGDMQLAPDGRIYISPNQAEVCLHVINYPEVNGIGCDFVQNAIQLYPKIIPMTGSCLPNMPNYKLGALVGSPCDTLNGINNVNVKKQEFKMYPNPASNSVNILIENTTTDGILEVFDATGVRIISENIGQNSGIVSLSTDGLSSGNYIVEFTDDRERWVEKLAVIH